MRFAMLAMCALFAALSSTAQAEAPKIPGLQDKYVEANGIRFHYVQAGSGPVMIFLHGFPADWYMWRDQLIEFSKDYTVIAPDTRGVSLTSKPKSPDDYKLKTLTDDVAALAEKVAGKDKKIILVGHDWGGLIAWAVPLFHPELVDKLIIINAPHPAIFAREFQINPIQRAGSDYTFTFNNFDGVKTDEQWAKDDFANLSKGILGSAMKAGIYTEADKAMWLASWRRPGSLDAGLNYYRANHLNPPFNDKHPRGTVPTSIDAKELLAGAKAEVITAPTLVVWGLGDHALQGGNLSGIEKYAPNSTYRLYDSADHWVSIMLAKEVNNDIRQFLGKPAPMKAAQN
jgi:pimeloyl-ACP methyl ester carboxylesterase